MVVTPCFAAGHGESFYFGLGEGKKRQLERPRDSRRSSQKRFVSFEYNEKLRPLAVDGFLKDTAEGVCLVAKLVLTGIAQLPGVKDDHGQPFPVKSRCHDPRLSPGWPE